MKMTKILGILLEVFCKHLISRAIVQLCMCYPLISTASPMTQPSTLINLDFSRSTLLYFININGAGKARQEIPPSTLAAGPTPKLRNMGLAASGSPAAMRHLSRLLAETTLAA